MKRPPAEGLDKTAPGAMKPALVALGLAPAGGRIAQLVEQLTLNQRVQGSNPCAPTNEINRPPMKSMMCGIVWGSLGVTLFGADTGMPLAPFSAIYLVASACLGYCFDLPPMCHRCQKGAGLRIRLVLRNISAEFTAPASATRIMQAKSWACV